MATYGYTFNSGDGVTPTRLNAARTVSDIDNADIKSDAAIALSKLANGALPSAITVSSANLVDGTIATADLAAASVTFAKLESPQYTGFRNRIVNGGMRIDQRNAGASVSLTSVGVFPVDRWKCFEDSDGSMTAEQVQDAPAEFTDSLVFTTGTADASLSAGQFCAAFQFIEGFNVSDLKWGTANAASVVVSFWVRSSLTGTFGGSLSNAATNRSYAFTYAISVANTWEKKSITIAGDVSGTWESANATGIRLSFGLGVGSSYSGSANAWAAANSMSATGAMSVIGTAGATFYITGVQLETGTVATPFEARPIGTELALCQRYFQKTYDLNTVAGSNLTSDPRGFVQSPSNTSGSQAHASLVYNLPVRMRAAPTVSYWDYAGNSQRFSTFSTASSSRTDNVNILNSGLQSETVVTLIPNLNANTYAAAALTMSAEL